MPYQEDIRSQLSQIQDMGTKSTEFASQISAVKQQKAQEAAAKKQAELQAKAQADFQARQTALTNKAAEAAAKQQQANARQMAKLVKQNTTLAKQAAARKNSYGSGGEVPTAGNGKGVLGIAASLKGIKYTWGGNTPASGLDCSGYTKYVYAKMGVNLPRTSASQAAALPRVNPKQAVPGDLVFFATNGRVHHVGIYAGNGMMWNSPHTGSSVRLQKVWRTSDTITYGRPPQPKQSSKPKLNAYAIALASKMGKK